MPKKSIVRHSGGERHELEQVVQLTLKAETTGLKWPDQNVAEVFSCRTKTVENVCQRLVKQTHNDAKRATTQVEKLLA